MALSLITDISATCYTSQLQKIELVSSGSAVEFRIYYQAQTYYSGNGQTLIFSASYNTRLSHVAIYDIGSLLETYLADRDGVQQFIFYFSKGTDSLEQTYAVIYCKAACPICCRPRQFQLHHQLPHTPCLSRCKENGWIFYFR